MKLLEKSPFTKEQQILETVDDRGDSFILKVIFQNKFREK